MLAVLYGVCYKVGIVADVTAKVGAPNPGPLSVPAVIQGSGNTGGSGPVTTSAAAKQAQAALGELRVAGPASLSGYDRAEFGGEWADVDGNGCDTRNDILARDLITVTFTSEGGTCTVATGTLADPYTGTTIAFVRGQDTSGAVQIDHVVALADAWRTGAQALTATQRTALANDPLNLLAVDGPTNESKGDSDAAGWLPPNPAERCAYVTVQVQVKHAYHLWVTSGEKAAIDTVLKGC